jgi:hypothetical protein
MNRTVFSRGVVRFSVLSFVFALALTRSAVSQPRVVATYTETPPTIDGVTDDPVWARSEVVRDFVQFEPVYGNPASERTEVRVLFDRFRLYIAFDCFTEVTKTTVYSVTQRDSPFFSDDYVGVYLDTFYDRRNCYAFLTNPLSTPRDMRIANEGLNQQQRMGGDASWDATWQVQTRRLPDRWSAEMAIPFSELRFDANGDVWGINFWRNIETLDQETTWADVGSRTYNVSRFGTLSGLDIPRLNRGKLLALTPYATLSPHKVTGSDAKLSPKAGLDVRYPLTSATIDVTMNPDFAQIEADPSQVNLSDVELRLTEKRPFFLEGGELYRTPIELFYTRRIEDLKFGAKMAGRVGSQNIALMSAQAFPVESPSVIRDDFGMVSNYSAFRYQRDVGSAVGVGLLAVNKHTPKLDRTNGAAGVDFSLRLPRDVTVVGNVATNWDKNRMPDIGQSPVEGWKTDNAWVVDAGRRTNTWRYAITAGSFGRDFHADSGFIERVDRRGAKAEIGYRRQFENRLVNRIGWGLNYERLTNTAGTLTNERLNPEFNLGVRDFFVFGGPQRYSYIADDGNRYTNESVDIFFGWFPPKYIRYRMANNVGYREGSRKWFVNPTLSVRPTERWEVEYSLQREVQYEPKRDAWSVLQRVQRAQTRYQFSQTAFATGSVEKAFIGDDVRFFVLYGAEYRPKSFLYVVYNEHHWTDPEAKRWIDRAVFVKLSLQSKVL